MDRAIPCSNMYLEEKWAKQYIQKHHAKLEDLSKGKNVNNKRMKHINAKDYIPSKVEADTYKNVLIERKKRLGESTEAKRQHQVYTDNLKMLRKMSNIVETPGRYATPNVKPKESIKQKESHKKSEIVTQFVKLKQSVDDYDASKTRNSSIFTNFNTLTEMDDFKDTTLFTISDIYNGNMTTSIRSKQSKNESNISNSFTLANSILDTLDFDNNSIFEPKEIENLQRNNNNIKSNNKSSNCYSLNKTTSSNKNNSNKVTNNTLYKSETSFLPTLSRSNNSNNQKKNNYKLPKVNAYTKQDDKIRSKSSCSKYEIKNNIIKIDSENSIKFTETRHNTNTPESEIEQEMKQELTTLKRIVYNEKNCSNFVAKEDMLSPGIGFPFKQRSKSIAKNLNKNTIKSDYALDKMKNDYKESRKTMALRCIKPIVVGDKKITLEVMAEKYQKKSIPKHSLKQSTTEKQNENDSRSNKTHSINDFTNEESNKEEFNNSFSAIIESIEQCEDDEFSFSRNNDYQKAETENTKQNNITENESYSFNEKETKNLNSENKTFLKNCSMENNSNNINDEPYVDIEIDSGN